MKYPLLLVVLIAGCGKHSEPQALDLGDEDGDSVPNAYDSNQYIADVSDVGNLRGTLRVQSSNKSLDVKFNNNENLDEIFLDLLTKGHLISYRNRTAIDRSYLRFDRTSLMTLDKSTTKVRLSFESEFANPGRLQFLSPSGKRDLGPVATVMDLELSSEELETLLEGSAKILVQTAGVSSVNEHVQRSTYSVYVRDGKNSRILMVSNKLSFDDLLASLKIKQILPVQKFDVFFGTATEHTSWWYNQIDAKTFVVSKTSTEQLRKNYFKGFQNETKVLSRSNGAGATASFQHSLKDSKIYINVRAKLVKREYQFRNQEEFFEMDGQDNFGKRWTLRCYNDLGEYRNYSADATLDDVLDAVVVSANGLSSTLREANPSVEEKADAHGTFWKIALTAPGNDVSFSLQSLPESTFFKAGLTATHCEKHRAPRRKVDFTMLNFENEFTLTLDSFVENQVE